MSPQLDTVLEISAIGTSILFGALVGLITLMYLLTGSWFLRRSSTPAKGENETLVTESSHNLAEEEAELDRQHRAVALAVAVGCAHDAHPIVSEIESDWRLVHRSRRLTQQTTRTKVRA